MNSNPPAIKQNTIDKIITAIAPRWGAQRLQSRMTMALANQFYGSYGGYEGASTTRRETNTWTPFASDADSSIVPDLVALRARSRDAARNLPLAGGAINTTVTSVVGGGLSLHAQVDATFLGMTEDEADLWQRDVEREWYLWADSQECDLARTLNFNGITELAFRSTLENGDVFALLPRKVRSGSPYSLKIQLVEADRVSNPNFGLNTTKLVAGVQKDDDGSPVGYHVQRQHPGNVIAFNAGQFQWDFYPAFGAKTGNRNVIHLFRSLRIGQSRGVPYLAPVIEPLKMLGRYKQAELMAAVVSAMFTVFIKTEGAQGLGNLPFAPGANNSVVKYGQDNAANPQTQDVKLGNGMIVELNKGESVEIADPKRPNTAFENFVQAFCRQIGVQLELPYEVLIKHFTASYSASRAALLEAWKFFNGRRQWLADNFCQVIYEIFLAEAVALGRINAPGFFNDPLIKKAYCGAMWIGPPKGQIDELKEIEAAEKRIEVGVSTIAQETISFNGGDFDRNTAQRKREMTKRKAAGLVIGVDPLAKAATKPKENPDQSDMEAV